MLVSDEPVQAVHLDGGNRYDDMRIDIAASHRRLDGLPRQVHSIRRSRLRNTTSLYFTGLCQRLTVHEALVTNGIRRRWLDDFREYWSRVLDGRPFWNSLDFFMLVHDYRKRQQHTSQLEWDDATQHLANWQHPSQIYSTLHNVRKLATHPVIGMNLWKRVPRGARILEYGCSLAPYYYCYRQFFNHLDCKWVLADIPNYPFHYAKYLYRNDANLEFATIDAEDFRDPLGDAGAYDVVILTTVLEHVDDPLFVSEYLLNRLKPGGLFVFDYIKSEGKGLDHPKALENREACLGHIMGETELLHGRIDDIARNISMCIMRKKAG